MYEAAGIPQLESQPNELNPRFLLGKRLGDHYKIVSKSPSQNQGAEGSLGSSFEIVDDFLVRLANSDEPPSLRELKGQLVHAYVEAKAKPICPYIEFNIEGRTSRHKASDFAFRTDKYIDWVNFAIGLNNDWRITILRERLASI